MQMEKVKLGGAYRPCNREIPKSDQQFSIENPIFASF